MHTPITDLHTYNIKLKTFKNKKNMVVTEDDSDRNKAHKSSKNNQNNNNKITSLYLCAFFPTPLLLWGWPQKSRASGFTHSFRPQWKGIWLPAVFPLTVSMCRELIAWSGSVYYFHRSQAVGGFCMSKEDIDSLSTVRDVITEEIHRRWRLFTPQTIRVLTRSLVIFWHIK